MRLSVQCLRVGRSNSIQYRHDNDRIGTILWDGRLNEMTSSADLEKWSWANQVGNYQVALE